MNQNDFFARVVHSYPDVLIGFGTIHPYDGVEALEKMTRCVTAINLKVDQSISSNSNHRPLNVLFIIGTLQLGGAENQVVTLAPVLSNGRYTIYVCCLRSEGVQADALRAKGISVISLNMRLRYWPIAVYKLYRLIKQLNAQIVHTHLYDAGIWGRLAGKLAGVPVIMTTEHGLPRWKKWHHLLFERFVNRFTDKMIAVSEAIRQYHINHQGVSPEEIITIPNAVNIERFSEVNSREQVRTRLGLDPSHPLVGTVARLAQAKRLDYLLYSAHIVCETVPQTHFLIIGDGPLRKKLEDQASQLCLLPAHVNFLGSRQDIPDLLSALDIFVLSSEREGLPVSLLEAMAASKPVVVTRVGGIPEVIQDGYNGLLVSPHDPPGLAKAILTLVENSTLRESVAKQGYQTVKERFSVTAVSQQFIALYDELLEKKKNCA